MTNTLLLPTFPPSFITRAIFFSWLTAISQLLPQLAWISRISKAGPSGARCST